MNPFSPHPRLTYALQSDMAVLIKVNPAFGVALLGLEENHEGMV